MEYPTFSIVYSWFGKVFPPGPMMAGWNLLLKKKDYAFSTSYKFDGNPSI